ncbi:MAG TPA: DUF1326 domain-containing protein [Candidatus Dormibacteraeota bacterium]|nr:DUF1326 domain-containing protein [Candidatus Dormibacteraeota bacterium]
MAWKLEGTYFENCNCDWVCPCSVTSFALPATGDRCQVILNYHVSRGEVDGVDVSGRSVSIVADSPKKMLDGGWRVGLIIDDKASKEQADKLTGVFAGQVGGPMANIAPLIGELLGVERLPIEYSDKGNRHSITIGDDVAIEVEDYAAQEGGETTKLTGVFHPSSSTLTIARPTASKIKAFGMEFKNAGKSAFSAPFNWAG